MIQSVQQYLSLLKKELSGCDRATIQDALSDTEEHLSTALINAMSDGNIRESDALAQVIEEYGTPEEVDKAYREIENRMAPVLSQVSYTEEPKNQRKKMNGRFGDVSSESLPTPELGEQSYICSFLW